MKKDRYYLVCIAIACVVIMGTIFVSAQWVLADIHYVIISPLTDKEAKLPTDIDLKKNSAVIELSSPAPQGETRFIVYHQGAPPEDFYIDKNYETYFLSSADYEPNLFSIIGSVEPTMVSVTFPDGFSSAMLRLSGAKDGLVLEIPRVGESLGSAFAFPLGASTKANLYIGNPHGVDTRIQVIYGRSTDPPFITQLVRGGTAQSISLDVSHTAVTIKSDAVDVFVILKMIDEEGNISITFILPG